MAKVYLETSFFSVCVTNRTTPKMLVWQSTSLDWWKTQARHFEIYVSVEVVRVHIESGSDLRKHAEQTRRAYDELRKKLNLKPVALPDRSKPRTGTHS